LVTPPFSPRRTLLYGGRQGQGSSVCGTFVKAQNVLILS
jgi:hypothetical protein